MRVLGVDPGSLQTGWGLLTGSGTRPEVLDSGVITLPGNRPMPERLAMLHMELTRLVARLEPECACVESPFHGVNARAALQLAHARGVVLAVLSQAGLEVSEYTPATVKKAVTGNGRAGKDQVGMMLGPLLGFSDTSASTDQTDALAVAYCHVMVGGMDRAVARSAGGVRKTGRRKR